MGCEVLSSDMSATARITGVVKRPTRSPSDNIPPLLVSPATPHTRAFVQITPSTANANAVISRNESSILARLDFFCAHYYTKVSKDADSIAECYPFVIAGAQFLPNFVTAKDN
jgi:hypothetical protein